MMTLRAIRPVVCIAALLFLPIAAGCGTTRPPWRGSNATANEPAGDGAGLDLTALPRGVRVALENGMFREDDDNGEGNIEKPSISGVGSRRAPPVEDPNP
jgi:hypothetical protein